MKPTFTYVLVLCLCVTAATAQNSSPYWSTSGNNNATGTSLLGTTNNVSLHLFTNNTQRMYIDSATGRVGIGTATPRDRLNVNSSHLENAFRAQVEGVTKLLVHTNGGVVIGQDNTPPVNGLYVVGNVGIGTNTPKAALDVNGTAHINGTINGLQLAGNERNNVSIGPLALPVITPGYNNTAVGVAALEVTSYGSDNTAIGNGALSSNNYGNSNTGIGELALRTNTQGYSNVAMGSNAMYSSLHNSNNVAVGDSALFTFSDGYNADLMVAVGTKAMLANTYGYYNTAIGGQSLFNNTTGYYNTALGASALNTSTTGYGNTALGYKADVNSATRFNATAVGYAATATADNQVMLGNTSVTSVVAAGSYVVYSDGRIKNNIKENVPGLSFINLLKPVTYHYDIQGLNKLIGAPANEKRNGTSGADKSIASKEKILYTGLVAQDVEAAAKKINYDFSGIHKPQNEKDAYGLAYSDFVVPLVKAVQELSKQNDSLKNELAAMHDDINALKAAILTGSNAPQAGATTVILSSGALLQNVPNPFANTTTINYTLPGNYTNASVIITDKGGRTLKTVSLNGGQSGSIQVEASTLAAGAYQYSLIINGRVVDTKQMLLAR